MKKPFSDGPTSIYIKGVTDKDISPQELEERARFKKRKEEIENSITANPHTLNQVVEYIMDKYHGVELSEESQIYHENKEYVKETLIMKHCPGLLEKKIKEISEELFPMDYHIYEINFPQGQILIDIEKHWGCLSCSIRGDLDLMDIVKDIWTYYGVTEEDIRTKSERFLDLVITLSS